MTFLCVYKSTTLIQVIISLNDKAATQCYSNYTYE